MKTKVLEIGNGYTLALLENVKNQIEEIVSRGINYGEINSQFKVVQLNKATHIYSNPVIEDNALYVDIELMNTSEAVKLKRLMEDKPHSFSCRKYGHQDWHTKEINDVDFVAVDYNISIDEIAEKKEKGIIW